MLSPCPPRPWPPRPVSPVTREPSRPDTLRHRPVCTPTCSGQVITLPIRNKVIKPPIVHFLSSRRELSSGSPVKPITPCCPVWMRAQALHTPWMDTLLLSFAAVVKPRGGGPGRRRQAQPGTQRFLQTAVARSISHLCSIPQGRSPACIRSQLQEVVQAIALIVLRLRSTAVADEFRDERCRHQFLNSHFRPFTDCYGNCIITLPSAA